MTFLTRLSLANKAIVGLVALVIVGFGLFATTSLKQELLPSLQIPGGAVVTSYPGASPASVETDVTTPIEDAVKAVSGVTKVTSTSATGISQVSIEWDYNADADKVKSDLQAAVTGVTGLPDDVKPQVISGSLDDLPVIQLAVSSDADQADLADKINKLALPKLRALDGVRDATLSGEEVKQVVVSLRADDLKENDVDPSTIPSLLQAAGVVVPAGSTTKDGSDLSVEVGSPLGSLDDLKNVAIPTPEDGPITLGDIADVKDEAVPETSVSRADGKPALSLGIVKDQDGNTVSVAHAVKDLLPSLQNEIGSNTKFTTVFDQSPFIEQSIHDLASEGGLGLIFAVLIILLFLLSFRSTIITAISIPMSLLIAMIGLWLGGFSLNILTLGALTVAVGRVVDDSIVVIENIKRRKGEGELDPGTIVAAVKEVAGAVTASTITTVAVFLPIAFVSGQTGELFRPFAVTVTISLLASLFVALTIVPVLAFWFMRKPSKPLSPERAERKRLKDEALAESEAARLEREGQKNAAKLERLNAKRAKHGKEAIAATAAAPAALEEHSEHSSAQNALQRGYLPILRASLAHPVATILIAVLVFLGTIGLSSQLKTDFIGDIGQNTMTISQELPKGTALETTDAAAKKIEGVLADQPGVQTYLTTVGSSGGGSPFGGGGSANTASISVTLDTDADSAAIADSVQKKVDAIKDVGEVKVQSASESVSGTSNIAVTVQGQDEKSITDGSATLVKALQAIPGLKDVESDLSDEEPYLKVEVDRKKAAAIGYTQAQVGQAVSAALRGTNLGTISLDDKSQDIILKSTTGTLSPDDIKKLELPITQVQRADAQKKASDKVQDKQDAIQEEAQAKADKNAADQEQKIRDAKADAQDQVAKLQEQLRQLRNAPVAPPAAPGAPGAQQPQAPTDPRAAAQAQQQAQQRAQQQALAQAKAQQQAQIEQLEKAITQAQAGVDQADEQLQQAQDAQADAAKQRAQSDELTQEGKDAAKATPDPARLQDIAKVTDAKAPATITRVDSVRSVTVTATPTGDDLSATTTAVTKAMNTADLPDGVTTSLGGVSQEQNDAFMQLGLAMLVAIAVVYMVMVATFRSLVQPFILLVSIPFAATGALGLLLITGTPLGVPSMIGLLMLIGIVVTNAIVLIDLINQHREQGASVDDAVIHGARLRLRPIIMTASATIGALIPMSLGLTGGGIFISKPLAIVVIGGLVSSTLLTLILVPVFYTVVEKRRERRALKRAAKAEHAALVAAGGVSERDLGDEVMSDEPEADVSGDDSPGSAGGGPAGAGTPDAPDAPADDPSRDRPDAD